MKPSADKSVAPKKQRLRVILLAILIPLVMVISLSGLSFFKTYNVFCWNGTSTKYYSKGKPQLITTYRKGRRHGTQTQYYKNGKKQFTKQYKNGQLDGVEKIWTEVGSLAEETYYKNGKRHGSTTYWNAKGQMERIDTFVNGLRTQTTQFILVNGQIERFDGMYKNGKPWNGFFWNYAPQLKKYRLYQLQNGKTIAVQ